MEVGASEIRIADLAFHVFDRSLHPDWFRTRACHRVTGPSYACVLRLVPGGHLVSWSGADSRVTEALAVLDEPLPEPGLRFRSNVRGERKIRFRVGPGVHYSTCFEIERVGPEVFQHISEEITLDARRGLFQRHAPAGRLAPPALGLVRVDNRDRSLSIQAIHTFPGELAIVRVQTLIETVGP